MSYPTYSTLPAQPTEFATIQERKEVVTARYEEYMAVLRAVEARAIATGDVIAADIPNAPADITYP